MHCSACVPFAALTRSDCPDAIVWCGVVSFITPPLCRAGRMSLRPYALFTLVWRSVQIAGICLSFFDNPGAAGIVFDILFMVIRGVGTSLPPSFGTHDSRANTCDMLYLEGLLSVLTRSWPLALFMCLDTRCNALFLRTESTCMCDFLPGFPLAIHLTLFSDTYFWRRSGLPKHVDAHR